MKKLLQNPLSSRGTPTPCTQWVIIAVSNKSIIKLAFTAWMVVMVDQV